MIFYKKKEKKKEKKTKLKKELEARPDRLQGLSKPD